MLASWQVACTELVDILKWRNNTCRQFGSDAALCARHRAGKNYRCAASPAVAGGMCARAIDPGCSGIRDDLFGYREEVHTGAQQLVPPDSTAPAATTVAAPPPPDSTTLDAATVVAPSDVTAPAAATVVAPPDSITPVVAPPDSTAPAAATVVVRWENELLSLPRVRTLAGVLEQSKAAAIMRAAAPPVGVASDRIDATRAWALAARAVNRGERLMIQAIGASVAAGCGSAEAEYAVRCRANASSTKLCTKTDSWPRRTGEACASSLRRAGWSGSRVMVNVHARNAVSARFLMGCAGSWLDGATHVIVLDVMQVGAAPSSRPLGAAASLPTATMVL
jgi:hypothetical protein